MEIDILEFEVVRVAFEERAGEKVASVPDSEILDAGPLRFDLIVELVGDQSDIAAREDDIPCRDGPGRVLVVANLVSRKKPVAIVQLGLDRRDHLSSVQIDGKRRAQNSLEALRLGNARRAKAA